MRKLYVIVFRDEYSFGVWQSKFYRTREAAERTLVDIRAFGKFPGVFEIQEITNI